MQRVLRWSLLLVLAIVVLAAIAWAFQPRPVPIEVAVASTGPMRVTVDEEGQTRIRERYVVSSPLRGRVRRIRLDAGDAVVAHETVLAIIEPVDPDLLDARAVVEAEARVRAAEAAVGRAGANRERARAAHEFAEAEFARVIDASERNAANPRELHLARTDARTAAEALHAATFEEEIAQYELEVAKSALLYAQGRTADGGPQMPLHAPISGAVLHVLQEDVAVVEPGAPLIEVGDPRDLEIVIDVLSTDAVRVRPGARVIIDRWGGEQPLEAIVRLVEPAAFTKVSALGIDEQRVNVIADFVSPPEERARLGDGFRIEAAIVTWEAPDVLQVPTSAIFRAADQWAVFTIDADGRARRQSIEVGHRTARTTEVLGGLEPDARVIAHPTDKISTGTAVRARTPVDDDLE